MNKIIGCEVKSMKKLLGLALLSLALVACGNSQYESYLQAQTAIAQANSSAEVARANAIAAIAKDGDEGAKVAAVLSLAMNGDSPSNTQATGVSRPRTMGDSALQWASLLVPTFAQLYTVDQNTRAVIRQSEHSMISSMNESDNAALTSISTNESFVAMAGNIQAPQANLTVGGNQNLGVNSGNYGRLAGNDLIDNTHTPTVITQPAPVIVTQPAPVIVTQPDPIIVNSSSLPADSEEGE